jgi:hypothetical protein
MEAVVSSQLSAVSSLLGCQNKRRLYLRAEGKQTDRGIGGRFHHRGTEGTEKTRGTKKKPKRTRHRPTFGGAEKGRSSAAPLH